MNTLLVFTVLFIGACVADVSHLAGVAHPQPPVEIVNYVQDILPDGKFHYAYAGADGIAAEAEGTPDGESRGSYHYIDTNGQPVDVTWTAGVNGFHAEGPSIATVPPSVVRTLEYNAAHPYEEQPAQPYKEQPAQPNKQPAQP